MADRDPNDPDTWIERHRVGTEPLSRLPCQCIFPGCTRKADGVAPFPSYGNAKKHVQKHLELMLRHFCDYCDWSSYNKGKTAEHEGKNHPASKKIYDCDMCEVGGYDDLGAAQRFHESLCGARGDRELNYAGRNWDRKQGGFVYLNPEEGNTAKAIPPVPEVRYTTRLPTIRDFDPLSTSHRGRPAVHGPSVSLSQAVPPTATHSSPKTRKVNRGSLPETASLEVSTRPSRPDLPAPPQRNTTHQAIELRRKLEPIDRIRKDVAPFWQKFLMEESKIIQDPTSPEARQAHREASRLLRLIINTVKASSGAIELLRVKPFDNREFIEFCPSSNRYFFEESDGSIRELPRSEVFTSAPSISYRVARLHGYRKDDWQRSMSRTLRF